MMTAKEEAEKYFSDAMECYENKDYEGAINYFTKAIELGANDKVIYSKRGLTYVHLEDYPKAIGDFSTVIKLDANDKSGYADRGFVYLRIKDYPKAIDDFTKAIESNINDKFIYGGRGAAYIGIKDYPKAINDFTKAIDLDENNKNAYAHRGLVYLYIKDYKEAIEDFRKVIKLNKNDNRKNNTTGDSDCIANKIKLTGNIFNLITDILEKNESKVLPDDETLNLIKLVYYCYDLMDEIKINPSDMKEEKFVHYTKASTLQYLLKKDHTAKLRLNNAIYMNDPEEGQILKKVLLGQNNELENLLKDEDVKNYTYLTCFSPYDKRDELPMWVHYGDGGKGVGLVFHNSFFDKTDLYEVLYIDIKNFDITKLDQNIRDKIMPILEFLKRIR